MEKVIYQVTFHHAHNFGAMLQAYALQQFAREQGFCCIAVDYEDTKAKRYISINRHGSWKEQLRCIISNFYLIMYRKEKNIGFRKFEEFYETYLLKTERCSSLDEVKNLSLRGETLLVGSDQMWTLNSQNKFSQFAMLQFGEGCRKCSYAVSVGKDISGHKEEFIRYINDFSYLSVREKRTMQLLQNWGLSCETHLDPVFLPSRDTWKALFVERTSLCKGKFILCYDLIKSPIEQRVLDVLKKKYGYPVILLTMRAHTELKADCVIRDAGPRDFITLIWNAEIVVTTSYHGVAFSLLFSKDFYAILTNHAPERIRDIMEHFGVEERMIRESVPDIQNMPLIDYPGIEKLIKEEREEAGEYLKKMAGM